LGGLTEGEYKRRRDEIRRQLDALNPVPSGSDNLPRLAQFLADVSSAWESATAEQQNKLARALFEEIWIKDKEVVFVKPRPELDPFFRLNYEESTRKAFEGVTSTRVELYRTPYLRNLLQLRGWSELNYWWPDHAPPNSLYNVERTRGRSNVNRSG